MVVVVAAEAQEAEELARMEAAVVEATASAALEVATAVAKAAAMV